MAPLQTRAERDCVEGLEVVSPPGHRLALYRSRLGISNHQWVLIGLVVFHSTAKYNSRNEISQGIHIGSPIVCEYLDTPL